MIATLSHNLLLSQGDLLVKIAGEDMEEEEEED